MSLHLMGRRGKARHPAYRAWVAARQRCFNINNPDFPNYGGRGIRVCDSWKQFENFWADMAASYAPGLTLDRIDVHGHYEPVNCRWASRRQQAQNRRAEKTSRFVGVHWDTRRQKWQAQYKVGQKNFHVGYFESESEAVKAYKVTVERII